MTKREPVLELVNATVVKGGATILHALNLTIHDGEHAAILGPNGAGNIKAEDLVISGLYATHGFLRPDQRTEEARAKAAASLARVATVATTHARKHG